MISQRARYAFKALIALSRMPLGESLQIGDIAAREGIPRSFLEHIMLELKRNHLVGSRRGKSGGYFLLRPAAEIMFGDVLRLIDGPLAPLPCLSRHAYKRCEDCPDEASCAVRAAFHDVFQATLAVVDHLSLADAVERSDKAREGLPGYGANPYTGAFN
jgi:Rrf2 family protein